MSRPACWPGARAAAVRPTSTTTPLRRAHEVYDAALAGVARREGRLFSQPGRLPLGHRLTNIRRQYANKETSR
ncbi:hypothetical protein ACUN29_41725 (plasmid) [Streptomyces sp. WC2508]|uniref:hypothetical protein n=1 Tax=Streptomyces sp. WC2508 TaxID=3461405 RepID=UPI0040448A37